MFRFHCTSVTLIVVLAVLPGCLSEWYAECKVQPNKDKGTGTWTDAVTGTIKFEQESEDGEVEYDIDVKGFDTADQFALHGFHVHQSDNISITCSGALGHYNPLEVNHAGKDNASRHVGDLGNIEEDANGAVKLSDKDSVIQLQGTHSIINRAIVIHQKEDDLGLGGHKDSLKTGNAGARLACCVIEAVTASSSCPTANWTLMLVAAAFMLMWRK